MCALANMQDHVFFRRGEEGLELRVINEKWSLPAEVSGAIDLSVGAFSKSFPIGANSSTSVSAPITDDDA